MKVNESTIDRVIRLIIGVVLIAAGYFFATGVGSIVLYVLGAVMLFTAATGFCLIYKLFGASTKKT
jgi:hypothetical protein